MNNCKDHGKEDIFSLFSEKEKEKKTKSRKIIKRNYFLGGNFYKPLVQDAMCVIPLILFHFILFYFCSYNHPKTYIYLTKNSIILY